MRSRNPGVMLGLDTEIAVIVAMGHGIHRGVQPGFEGPEATLSTVLAADPDGILAGVPFVRPLRVPAG